MTEHKKKHPLSGWKRYLFLALVVAMVLLSGCGAVRETFFPAPTPTPSPTPVPTPTPTPAPVVQTVTFSATGDNLIHSGLYQQAAQRAENGDKYDFTYAYENMADFYSGYDVNWINQETLVSDELPPSTYPQFSTPGECARALYDLGIRVFALSNNHTYDKYAKGIAATRRFWAAMPEDVVTTGLWELKDDYDRIPMHTVNGVTIAYLAYTEGTNGLPMPEGTEARVIYTRELELMEQQIRLAKQQADFVVVGAHWGIEYSHTYSEAQQTLAQKFADWGADVIVGTHPHVLQDAAWLTAEDGRSVFVAYSLGNFISTQNEPPRTVGAILDLTFRKTTTWTGEETLEVLSPVLHPVVTHYEKDRTNCRTYLLKDYTPELGGQHGLCRYYPEYGYDLIVQTVTDNISPEFLAEDWK